MSQPSSSACYCGCNTKRNQLLWGLAVGLGVVAGICCIIFIVQANSCNNFEVSGCNSAAAFFWIFILFAIGSSIPCYMMCCCSNPPQHERKLVVAAPAAPHTVVHATVVNAPPPHMHQSPYDARGVPVGVPPPPPPPGAVPVGPPQPPPHTAVQMPPPPPPKMM